MYGYTGQGFTNEQRLKFMADSIKAENAKKPIDLCLFLGDLSENNLVLPGKDGVQYVKNNIYPLLKTASGKQIPTYFLSGNHDCYSDSQWQSTFGYYKNFTISCGNFAFICLDAFADSVNRTSNGSFGYTKVDKTWFQQQVAKYSSKKIIVISHYINSTDTDLMNLIANTPNIMCSFEGHVHDYYKVTRGNKACYDCGNFSYPVSGFTLNNSWGFRNIDFNNGKLQTEVIEPAYKYTSYSQSYYISTPALIKQF